MGRVVLARPLDESHGDGPGERWLEPLRHGRVGRHGNWFILVDASRCVTNIYCGSQGNWDLNRRYVCSTGRAGTPTVIGEYEVFGKGYSFGHGYTCYYYTQFYGDYLFHSSPYYVNSNRIMDPTMGVPSSAGCVRLEIQNAKWIYDNIPYGTKVATYN